MSTDPLNPYQPPATSQSDLVDPHQLFDGRLRMTARGLRLMYVGFFVMVVGWIGLVPISLFGMPFGALVIGIFPMLGVLLTFIGPFFCLTVPVESGLRPSIIVTVILQLFTVVGYVLLSVFDASIPDALSVAVAFIMPMLTMGALLYFLHRLTVCMARLDLSRRVRNVSILAIVTVLAMSLPIFSEIFPFNVNVSIVYTVVMLLMVLVLFVAFANLLGAISRGIRRPSDGASASVIF